MILFLVPETRLLKLEEIDFVFDEVETPQFRPHALQSLRWQLHVDNKPERLYAGPESEVREEREQANQTRQETRSGAVASHTADVESKEFAVVSEHPMSLESESISV
jgi:hypothetical protein